FIFFCSSRRRHTRSKRDWSSDVCSSDLIKLRYSNGDHGQAFLAYQQHLNSLIRTKQDAARNLGTAFAPRNRRKLFLRNTSLRFMGLPFIADLVMGRSLRDPIELPEW